MLSTLFAHSGGDVVMTATGASHQMGAFRMGESGKVEAWAEEQVEAIEEIKAKSTLNLMRQRPATSAMAKVTRSSG